MLCIYSCHLLLWRVRYETPEALSLSKSARFSGRMFTSPDSSTTYTPYSCSRVMFHTCSTLCQPQPGPFLAGWIPEGVAANVSWRHGPASAVQGDCNARHSVTSSDCEPPPYFSVVLYVCGGRPLLVLACGPCITRLQQYLLAVYISSKIPSHHAFPVSPSSETFTLPPTSSSTPFA